MSATLVTDYLFEAKPRWSGTIGSGGVAASNTTTIPLASAANLDNGDAYVFVVNRVTSAGVKNELSAMETVIGELSGTNFINCVRGQEGTAQAWDAGTVVEILFTATHWNKLITAWEVAHNQNGTHKSGLALPSPVITTPQINDTSADHQYILGVSELTADRTITLPLLTGNDDFVFEDHTQTLTNKTLSTGVALNASASENFTYHSLARQAIINGNFDVWQRGTSFTPANGDYSADRWQVAYAVDGGTLPTDTITRATQTAGALQGSYYYCKLTVDGTGASFGTNAYYELWQKIENGVRNLCGLNKTVTVSFYAKSSIANKKLGISLVQDYGDTGTPTADEEIQGTEITLTSSWVKYTHTFTTNTLSGKTFGTSGNDQLRLVIGYMWGATRGSTKYGSAGAEGFVGAGDIDIAQVQLCAGDVALPFQPRSYQDELIACQRYYQLVGKGSVGRYVGSSSVNVGYQFLVTPRITTPTPTLTTTSPVIFRTAIGNDTGSSSSITSSGGGWVQINGLSGGATNEICVMTDNYIVWNAEL